MCWNYHYFKYLVILLTLLEYNLFTLNYSSVKLKSDLFVSPIGARTLKMPALYYVSNCCFWCVFLCFVDPILGKSRSR